MKNNGKRKPKARDDVSSAPDYRLDEEALAPGTVGLPMTGGSPPTPEPEERLLLRPREAAALLAISPRKLWELTNMHEVPCVRIGRSLRYPRDGMRAWVERRQRGNP